jgi:hypothetical protein
VYSKPVSERTALKENYANDRHQNCLRKNDLERKWCKLWTLKSYHLILKKCERRYGKTN